jgi:hypothetical protein
VDTGPAQRIRPVNASDPLSDILFVVCAQSLAQINRCWLSRVITTNQRQGNSGPRNRGNDAPCAHEAWSRCAAIRQWVGRISKRRLVSASTQPSSVRRTGPLSANRPFPSMIATSMFISTGAVAIRSQSAFIVTILVQGRLPCFDLAQLCVCILSCTQQQSEIDLAVARRLIAPLRGQFGSSLSVSAASTSEAVSTCVSGWMEDRGIAD